jgi:hypothetical protein
MTMIEQVARAICKAHGAFDPDALTNSVVAWKYYIPEARAAIAGCVSRQTRSDAPVMRCSANRKPTKP